MEDSGIHGKMQNRGVLMGAAAPVVITSRSDAPETKLNSIALALLIAGNKDKK